MAKFITKPDQQWTSARLGGLVVEECPLWQGADAERLTAFVVTAEDRAELYVSFGPVP